MNSEKRILILTPSFTARGGITNYFMALEGRFKSPVKYFVRGSRNWPRRKNAFIELLRSVKDFLKLRKVLRTNEFVLLQTNTSFGKYSLIRDGFFLKIAQNCSIKTIVFFRGWDDSFERKLKGKIPSIFKRIYFKTDIIFVLSKRYKQKLINWGYEGEIIVETTVVDDKLISGFNQADLLQKISSINSHRFNFLFLSRTEVKKGLYETIDAFEILHKQFPNTSLTIAGDGFELENAKEHVNDLGLSNVTFTGFVTGSTKEATYVKADLYIFPSYTEGMPNSVLEAMAFGLPVITTPVGGLNDFFIDGEHGSFIKNNNGVEIARLCENLMLDQSKYSEIAKKNFEFSRSRFSTGQVVKRLEKIYESLISN